MDGNTRAQSAELIDQDTRRATENAMEERKRWLTSLQAEYNNKHLSMNIKLEMKMI